MTSRLHDGTNYPIVFIFLRTNGQLEIDFDTDLTTATQGLTLNVDGTAFAFEDASSKLASFRRWNNTGLSWTAGNTVSLTLTEPTTGVSPRSISIADASAAENAGHLLFEVTLSRSFQNTVKVDFETISGGTATEGVDYHARRTYTHVILAGDKTAQMGFALIEDTVAAAGETVKVRLSNARVVDAYGNKIKFPRHHDRRGDGNDQRADDHHDQRAGSDHSDQRRDRGRGQRVPRFQCQALAEA